MDRIALSHTSIFENITPLEQNHLLNCLNTVVRNYEKGDCLFREQESINYFGIILSGSVEASKLESSGKRLIISRPSKGNFFGDIFSLHSEHKSPVTVTALEKVSALLIPTTRLLEPCEKHCESHNKLIRNMLNSVSKKYFELHNRFFCVTRSTMREKILYFLENASGVKASGRRGHIFIIPYSRASLAEYLNVERSALSRELSAMKRDGLIDYHKNTFCLL